MHFVTAVFFDYIRGNFFEIPYAIKMLRVGNSESAFETSYMTTVGAYHKKKRCLEATGLDCKEKILSEEYIDFVIDFSLEEIFSSLGREMDFCYQEIGEGYGIISINRNQLPDTSLLTLDYHYFW